MAALQREMNDTASVQGRCEQLEKRVEWVKSERDEAQKVAEASAARVKELETAASRQKGHCKDDSKKAAKESKAALQKAEVCGLRAPMEMGVAQERRSADLSATPCIMYKAVMRNYLYGLHTV